VLSDIGGQAALTNPITGTGTTNFLPKFTGSSALGNSQIFDNGTSVGIGTTTPNSSYKLDINGNAKLFYLLEFLPSSGRTAIGVNGTDFEIYNGSIAQTRLTINQSGNVGIGTTSPQTLLSIQTSGDQNVLSPIITSQTSGVTYTGLYSIRDGAGDQRGLAFQVYTANVGLNERMRITSSGELLVGTTSALLSASGRGVVEINGTSSSVIGLKVGNSLGSYLYSTNTDTELYSTNALKFAVAGAERMRLTAAGNFGIGTTSPSERLEVQNGAAGAKIRVSNSGGGFASLECSSNASSVAQLTFTNQLSLIGGNVGIGTTSPDSRLHLGTNVNQSIKVNSANANAAYLGIFNDAAALTVNRDPATGNIQDATKATSAVYVRGEASNGYITFETTATNNVNSTERMRITAGGNVGIGTTAAVLNGVVTIAQRTASGDGSNTLAFNHFNANNNYINFGWYGTSLGSISQRDGSQIVFNAPNGLFLNTTGGNVGIGTTSPLAKATVRGGNLGNTVSMASTVFSVQGNDQGIFMGSFNGTPNFGSWIQAGRELFDIPFNLAINPNGGNVGIGTTSPAYSLDVAGSTNVSVNNFHRYNGDTGIIGSATAISGGSNTQLGIRASSDILFATNGASERMRITSGGNVGIGTTSPSERLTVSGNGVFSGNLTINTSSADNGFHQIFGNNSFLNIGADKGGGAILRYNGNGNLDITPRSGYNTIFTDGNVGIGTSSPAARLTVNSTSTQALLYFNTTQSGWGFSQWAFNDTTYGYVGQSNSLFSGGSSSDFGIRAENNLTFGIGSTERMRITSSGNVGIGTTSPSARLHVVGNGLFSGSVTATAFFASSDIRLKDIISHDGDMITYKWKDGRDDKIHYGYSAQNLQNINPNLVNKNDDGFLSVNYTETLVLKVRELEKEVQLLKAQIN
jgi:hypothetical protein